MRYTASEKAEIIRLVEQSAPGLGRERDEELNSALEAALHPIADAAIELGASQRKANLLMVDCFAHATGLLLLLHTGRIRCSVHRRRI